MATRPHVKKALKEAKILAIDDDEWFIRLLVKKFQDVDPGFKITPALTANEAIEKLESDTFDCILCDHRLPGTIQVQGRTFPSDGIHLMRKFTTMNIDTPVIFVTGQGSEEIASEALQLGASGYFIKRVQPGYFSLMATSIRQTIDRYWLQKELQKSEARYRDLFENSAGLIIILDSEGKLQETNINFLSIYGYTVEDSRKLTLEELAYPEDFEKWQEMLKSICKGNTESRMLRSRTKYDQILHLDITARPIYGKKTKTVTGIQAIVRDITQQVKTQQALIDSEEKHRKIVEGSIEGIIIMDQEGTILDWNPAASTITGFSAEDTLGQSIWTIIEQLEPTEIGTPTIKILDELKDFMAPDRISNIPKFLEYSIKNAEDGSNRILEVTLFIIEHSRGYRIAKVMRDVTAKKMAEEETRSYAQRFQTLIEQAAIGVWITNITDESTIYVNESVAQLLDYSPHEMIGVSVLDFVTPNSADLLKEKTRQRLQGEKTEDNYELEFYNRSGTKVYARVTAAAIKDENGNVIETYGFIRDITQERQREKELRTTKEFLESIIDSMIDGLYTYDQNLKITSANPRLKEMLGYKKHTLEGKSIFDIFPSYEHTRVKEITQERMAGKKSEGHLLLTYMTAQGEEVKASVSSVPLIADDKVTGAVVTVSDITEQRRIEKYLRQVTKEYETLVTNLPLGWLKIDNMGRVIAYNRSAQELLDFTETMDLKTINIINFHPFQEAGLATQFRDLLYQKDLDEKVFDSVLEDSQGMQHHLKFYPFPIYHELEPRITAWFLIVEKV
ncbi:MAG: PAS domain S-box protein [Candidatus Heimdallarchaeota archaeon]|nr:MAG: PAS domain S-box protein [Candidatus Heimdallarchaeota archaeon]